MTVVLEQGDIWYVVERERGLVLGNGLVQSPKSKLVSTVVT